MISYYIKVKVRVSRGKPHISRGKPTVKKRSYNIRIRVRI